MNYSQRVRASFTEFWKSPALLSVLLLEFIITILLAFLFFFSDAVLLGLLNNEAMAAMAQTGVVDWGVFLNLRTIIVMGALLIIQGIVFVYVDSFFKAGFYGMLKNLVQDGTTVFGEFLPSAKRYWTAMFRFLLLRYALLLLVMLPFIVAALQFVGTTPALATPGQYVALLATLATGLLLALLISFWLLYAEAAIVFNDAGALEGARDSARLANKRVGFSFGTLLTFLGIMALGVILTSAISFPFDYVAEATQALPWMVLADVARFILNLVTISATVIASIFVFLSYRELVEAPQVRKAPAVKHAIAKRKKA